MTDPDAPECPFCTNPASWTDRGWRCLPCGEPCAPDEDEIGDVDPRGSLEPCEGRLSAMAGDTGVHRGGER